MSLSWPLFVLQWLHVLGGVFWIGSAILLDLIILPSLRTMNSDHVQAWLRAFNPRYGPVIAMVAGLTILLGIVRGIASGVLGELGSPYGLTWIASILLGAGTAWVSARLTGPTAQRLATAKDGSEMHALLERLATLGRIELAALLILFTFMIAMRFGY